MKTYNQEDVIYQLTIEDIQNVAEQELGRALTENEIKEVIENLGNYIPWYDAIQNTILVSVKITQNSKV